MTFSRGAILQLPVVYETITTTITIFIWEIQTKTKVGMKSLFRSGHLRKSLFEQALDLNSNFSFGCFEHIVCPFQLTEHSVPLVFSRWPLIRLKPTAPHCPQTITFITLSVLGVTAMASAWRRTRRPHLSFFPVAPTRYVRMQLFRHFPGCTNAYIKFKNI